MTNPRQRLAAIALVVRNYEEAREYYSTVLGFDVVEDLPMGGGKRWLVVAPPGDSQSARLVLAEATSANQLKRVGDQTGGRVFLFLHTDDFHRDYQLFQSRGVKFRETPREEAYGTVAVFQDLYGNLWDLIQPR